MTRPMTTISASNLAFKNVDLTERLRQDGVPAYASVNGHAQALIIRPHIEVAITSNSRRHQS